MFHFLLLVSRQGKVRLCRWFGDCEAEKEPKSFLHAAARSCKERNLLIKDAASRVLQRNARQCNVVEWKDDTKLVYKRFGYDFFIYFFISFCCCLALCVVVLLLLLLLFVCLFVYLFVYLFVCFSLSIYPSLSFSLSLCLFICFVCLFASLS